MVEGGHQLRKAPQPPPTEFNEASVENDDERVLRSSNDAIPDSKVRGANMGPIWGRQDPGGTHVGPMNLAIWDQLSRHGSTHFPC